MRLPKFDYVEPPSIKEASSILMDQPESKVLAGGTDLLVNMKHRVEVPLVLINLKRISSLDYIRQENGSLRIGALTPLKKLYNDNDISGKAVALSQAASSVGSYHHQSMGTLGGNICQQNRCMYYNQSKWWRSARPTCYKAGGETCHVVNKEGICYSSYCGDVSPALLVLDAMVILEGQDGPREVSFADFFTGDGKAPLNFQDGEILTEVIIPEASLKGFSSYVKIANRESIDFPIVGHGFWASEDRKDYRISFTGVDRRPVLGKQVERFLQGTDLNEEVMEEAASMAAKEARVVKNSVYSPSYKRKLMGLLLKQNLKEAKERSE